ncbi:MAG: sigma-70 family RNA polymerase sigma factor [Planctomycetota bacterium]
MGSPAIVPMHLAPRSWPGCDRCRSKASRAAAAPLPIHEGISREEALPAIGTRAFPDLADASRQSRSGVPGHTENREQCLGKRGRSRAPIEVFLRRARQPAFSRISHMSLAQTGTAQLLRGWHGGDSKCLGRLVELHLPWLQEQVRRRLGPALRARGETMDYVQDALVEFFRYGPRFVLDDTAQLRALLLRVIDNSLHNKHRWLMAARRDLVREHPLPSTTVLSLQPGGVSDKTPSQSAQRHEDEAWVRLAMELLPYEAREILVLRLWQGLAFADIGTRLGIAANLARARHHRALRSLASKTSTLRSHGLAAVLDAEPLERK